MSDFLNRALGVDSPENDGRQTKAHIVDGTDPVMIAVQNLLMHVMNPPGDMEHAVREVGDSCTIVCPNTEVMAINKKTGESETINLGTYTITIKREG